jgi:hypothetical protein
MSLPLVRGGSAAAASLAKEFDQYWNSEYAYALSKKTDSMPTEGLPVHETQSD